MSDKFYEEFLNRLEMPLPEAKIVTMADKVREVHVACMGFAGDCTRHVMDVGATSLASLFFCKKLD